MINSGIFSSVTRVVRLRGGKGDLGKGKLGVHALLNALFERDSLSSGGGGGVRPILPPSWYAIGYSGIKQGYGAMKSARGQKKEFSLYSSTTDKFILAQQNFIMTCVEQHCNTGRCDF